MGTDVYFTYKGKEVWYRCTRLFEDLGIPWVTVAIGFLSPENGEEGDRPEFNQILLPKDSKRFVRFLDYHKRDIERYSPINGRKYDSWETRFCLERRRLRLRRMVQFAAKRDIPVVISF